MDDSHHDNSILQHVVIHRIGEVRDKRATDSNVYVRRALGKNAEQSFLVSKTATKRAPRVDPWSLYQSMAERT